MKRKDEFRIVDSALQRRGIVTRRDLLKRLGGGLGAVLSVPLAQAHPIYRHLMDPSLLDAATEQAAADEWKPQVLNADQNEALIAIAECIVPGSTKAHVNRVIDVLLTVETAGNREAVHSALTSLDVESKKRFNLSISSLQDVQRRELLSACASQSPRLPAEHDDSAPSWKTNQTIRPNGPANLRDHFEVLKGWIVATYYSSEQGMRELGWTDEFYYESPEECSDPSHEEHTSKPSPTKLDPVVHD